MELWIFFGKKMALYCTAVYSSTAVVPFFSSTRSTAVYSSTAVVPFFSSTHVSEGARPTQGLTCAW